MIFLEDLPTMKIGRRIYALSRKKPYTKGRFIIPMFANFDDTLKYINVSQQNSPYHLHLKRVKAIYVDRIYKEKILTQRVYMKNDLKKVYDYVKDNCPEIKYMYRNMSQYSNRNLFYDVSLINELIFSKDIKNYKFVDEYYKTIIKDVIESAKEYDDKYILFDISGADIVNVGDIKKSDYTTPNLLYLFLYILKYNPDLEYMRDVFKDTTIIFTSEKGLFKVSFDERLDEYFEESNSDISDLLKDILLRFRRLKTSDDDEESRENDNDRIKHEVTDAVIDTLEDEDAPEEEIDPEGEIEKEQNENEEDIPLIEEDVLDKVINMTDEPEKAKEISKILKEVRSKSLERVSEIGEKERKYIEDVMNVEIDDMSYSELLEEIKDIDVPKDSYDITSIDKYNENSFVNFNKTYDEKLKKFDITEIAQSFSNTDVPLYVQKIETEDSSDELNFTEDVKMKFKDLEGNRHNVKITLPKLVYDRFVYLGGSKKNIIGQIMSNPITKNEEYVIITSNRNKLRMSYKGGKYLSPMYSKFVRGFKKFEDENKSDIINFESAFETNFNTGETTREYNGISRFMSEINVGDVNLIFDYEKSTQLYDNKKENEIVLGEIEGKKIILDKETESITTEGEYKGLGLSEFLIKLSEKRIPDLYKYIEEKNTVPKTIVYTSVKILGKDAPLILILTYLMGLDALMEKMDIDYRLETKEKKPKIDKFKEGIIEFEDTYLIYKYDSMANISIMSYLQRMDLSGYELSELEDKDVMASILEDEMGSHNFPVYIDNYNNTMIDAITKNILVHFSLPTEFTDLLIYANYLLSTAVNEKDIDIRNSRVRYQELITATMANVLAEEYEKFSVAKKRGNTKSSFSIDKNAVIKKLYELPNLEEYSTVNPAREIDKYSSASMKGLSGLNLDRAYTADKRLYDPSFYGKFSMASAYSGSIGVVKHFGVDPKILSARGFFENVDMENVDDLDSKTLLSISEVLTPMTTSKDDAPRTAMNLSQTNHLMGVEDADPLMVSTGADEALAHMSNEFVRKSKKDGVISNISGNYITVEYSDGTEDSFPINSVEKNSAKSMYISNEMKLMPKIKVGKKIKAGDVLAYNKRFFKTDGYSLHFTPGPIVTLALHSAPETYEDSTMVSRSLTKRLATKVIKKYAVLLKNDAKIHESAAEFKEVRSGEPLMVFESMTGDEEVDEFLNVESSELNQHEKKVKRGGRIVDMRVYRTSNLEEYSNSIQYHIRKIDDFLLNSKQSNAKQLEEHGSTENKILFGKKNAKVKVGDKINGIKLNKDEVLFEYYVESYDIFSTGDKGTNYTSLKAINARVYDDEKMPTGVETGRSVDVVLSPNSPMKRMTNSVFISGLITGALRKLVKQCKEDMGIE